MSYETMRFGWQKLLINQVPQKGGGGYGPPPPDYAAQWNAAQQAFTAAQAVVDYTQAQYARFANNPSIARDIIIDVNNRANGEIARIDGIINQTSGIPDYIFAGGTISKGEAINVLQTTRNNLARCVNVVPDPPPPPPPPPVPPPPTSPTIQITPPVLEPPIPSRPRPVAPAQPIGCLPRPVIRNPVLEILDDPQNPLSTQDGEWEPTGTIEGVGTYSLDSGPPTVPTGISLQAVCYAEDGNSYPYPGIVPKGKRWSFRPWRWRPRSCGTPTPPPPPTQILPKSEIEILQAELARQLKQLQAINRILNKPVDPAPPEIIYPSTSWQYEFWSKGYSLHEIAYAEEKAAQQNLLTTTNGDFALFKVKVEDLLQDAILGKSIPLAISQEVIPTPIIGFDPISGRPTIPPDLYVNPQPYQPSQPVLDEPVRCPVPLPVCSLPPVYVDDKGKRVDPKKIPGYLRRNRQFISRGIRNKPIDINDLPSVATCAPNTVPRPGNWEDCLIGTGATVDQLETIRRAMAKTKLAPNADVCEVTKNMLTKLTTSNVKDPLGINKGPNMNDITGVVRCAVAPGTIEKTRAIAQRKVQQARRGALTNRNRRPTASLNEGGN